MKLLILVISLAYASAGWIPLSHHHEEHVPIIHKGVPLETPEVQHAKAEHLAAHAEAKAKAGYQPEISYEHHDGGYEHQSSGLELGGHGGHGGHYSTAYSIQHVQHGGHHEIPQEYPHEISEGYTHQAYETSHSQPLIGHDGKPLDTPEVEEAKAKHFAAVHEALAKTSGGHHYRKRRSLLADEHGYTSHVIHDHSYGGYGHGHEYGFQGVDHKGHPLDTPEVEYAKALHFQAHEEAKARAHGYGGGYSHEGPQDTYEVQLAKAKHFAAHEEAKARLAYAGHGHEVSYEHEYDHY